MEKKGPGGQDRKDCPAELLFMNLSRGCQVIFPLAKDEDLFGIQNKLRK
jgi:hypothetical protein